MSETAINNIERMELRGGLSSQQVEEMQQTALRYPYFVLPRLSLLAQALYENSDNFEQQLQESALYAYDRKNVLLQLNKIESRWLHHTHTTPTVAVEEETEKEKDATQSLIDSFLNNYEDKNPTQTETNILFAPAVDYTAKLAEQADAPASEKEKEEIALIDSFIEKASSNDFLLHPEKEEEKEERPTTTQREVKEDILSLLAVDDSFLTESLAKIYIKQRRYSKALEIIKKLSLKYPEKNVYFADQIRFLEKLITNINLK